METLGKTLIEKQAEKNNGTPKAGASMLDMLKASPQYEIKAEPAEEQENDLFEGIGVGEEASEIGEDFFNPPQEQQRSEKAPPPSETNAAQAKMAVKLLDMITSRIGAAISGEGSDKYKMPESDKDDLTTLTADYFATLQTTISPALMWWSAIITIMGATIYKAVEDKKAVQKVAEYKKAKEAEAVAKAQMYAQQATDSAIIANAQSRAIDVKPEVKRERFEIDADGLYERNEKGVYVSKKDRAKDPAQIPPPDVLRIIQEGKEMNLSQGEINRLCREFLYGESN